MPTRKELLDKHNKGIPVMPKEEEDHRNKVERDAMYSGNIDFLISCPCEFYGGYQIPWYDDSDPWCDHCLGEITERACCACGERYQYSPYYHGNKPMCHFCRSRPRIRP